MKFFNCPPHYLICLWTVGSWNPSDGFKRRNVFIFGGFGAGENNRPKKWMWPSLWNIFGASKREIIFLRSFVSVLQEKLKTQFSPQGVFKKRKIPIVPLFQTYFIGAILKWNLFFLSHTRACCNIPTFLEWKCVYSFPRNENEREKRWNYKTNKIDVAIQDPFFTDTQ